MQAYLKTLLVMIFSLSVASYSIAMDQQTGRLKGWIDCEALDNHDLCHQKNCITCNEAEYHRLLHKHLQSEQAKSKKK